MRRRVHVACRSVALGNRAAARVVCHDGCAHCKSTLQGCFPATFAPHPGGWQVWVEGHNLTVIALDAGNLAPTRVRLGEGAGEAGAQRSKTTSTDSTHAVVTPWPGTTEERTCAAVSAPVVCAREVRAHHKNDPKSSLSYLRPPSRVVPTPQTSSFTFYGGNRVDAVLCADQQGQQGPQGPGTGSQGAPGPAEFRVVFATTQQRAPDCPWYPGGCQYRVSALLR